MVAIQNWGQEWAFDAVSKFYLRSNSVFSGGLNAGAANVYGPQAQVWMAPLTAAAPNGTDKRRVQQRQSAFIHSLGGIAGLVRVFDPDRPRPGRDITAAEGASERWSDGTLWLDGEGWATDSELPPFVTIEEAAVAGARSILVSGLPASQASCIWADDRMEVRPNGIFAEHGHYYGASNDAPSDADGWTRINIDPGLRAGIARGDMLVLHYPTSVFRMIDDDQGVGSRGLGGLVGRSFSLMEVLP